MSDKEIKVVYSDKKVLSVYRKDNGRWRPTVGNGSLHPYVQMENSIECLDKEFFDALRKAAFAHGDDPLLVWFEGNAQAYIGFREKLDECSFGQPSRVKYVQPGTEDTFPLAESSADLSAGETLFIDTPIEVGNRTTLVHKTLCIGESVDIRAAVVCEHCEILIESRAQIRVGEHGSLTLKNCTIKSAEDGTIWRFPKKFATLLAAYGPLRMEGCLVEGIVIDSLDQWAVEAGHAEVYDTKFAGCEGNFFKVSRSYSCSGTKFIGKNLTIENHKGRFLGNRDSLYGTVGDMDRVVLKNCNFRFSPRIRGPWRPWDSGIKDGIFMGFTGRMTDCTFTAEGYPANWGGICLTLTGEIEDCTFTNCSRIVTEDTDFENCVFTKCDVRDVNDDFEDEDEEEE